MFWIVQTNGLHDRGTASLRENLVAMGVDHVGVECRPFDDRLYCDQTGFAEMYTRTDDERNDTFTYGSQTLTRAAKAMGFKPAAYEQFDYRQMLEHWGDDCLNSDALIGPLRHLQSGRLKDTFKQDRFFIRPLNDDKSFAGTVMPAEEIVVWISRLSAMAEGEYTTLPPDTEAVLSSPKVIDQEYRLIIVEGRVVTGSLYKDGPEIRSSAEVPAFVEGFAAAMAQSWQPARAYCLDVAVSEGRPYVLEVGCCSNAGLYDCNTAKFIAAIEALPL